MARFVALAERIVFVFFFLLVYLHDSFQHVVWTYDFDLEAGSISNRRVLIDRKTSGGSPDGLVVEYGPLEVFFFY